MAAKRYDALTVREYQDKQSGETKARWTKIGVAFVSERDDSIKVMLDANPIDGIVHLRLPRQEGDQPRSSGRQQSASRQAPKPAPAANDEGPGVDDDGSLPF
jgi:hypothetical protein